MASLRTTSYAVFGLLLLVATASPGAHAANPPPNPFAQKAPTQAEKQDWRRRMVRIPRPKRGCFVSSYPQTTWQEVQCKSAPQRPLVPGAGLVPRVSGRPKVAAVGDGSDFSVQTTTDVVTAEGSFVSVSGVTSETGAGVANAYTLQLNTEFFPTTTCNTGASGCEGWEQFVFFNEGSATAESLLFIQYWMIGYGSNCPAGWTSFDSTDCYRNSQVASSIPTQAIATLGDLAVTGVAPSSTSADSVTLSIGSQLYSLSGASYFPDLAQHWNTSEFNVFGPGSGSQAVFNSGSTIVVRTAMDSGTATPSCVSAGFTAETNNLTLANNPTVESGALWPSIVFTESNASSSTATCSGTGVAGVAATATTIDSGNSTTLVAFPVGSGSFRYQWYVGVAGNTSTPISGATGISVIVSPGSTTSYWVLITSSGGQVQYSQTITITVVPASSATDAPLPLWALGALGAAFYMLARRKLVAT